MLDRKLFEEVIYRVDGLLSHFKRDLESGAKDNLLPKYNDFATSIKVLFSTFNYNSIHQNENGKWVGFLPNDDNSSAYEWIVSTLNEILDFVLDKTTSTIDLDFLKMHVGVGFYKMKTNSSNYKTPSVHFINSLIEINSFFDKVEKNQEKTVSPILEDSLIDLKHNYITLENLITDEISNQKQNADKSFEFILQPGQATPDEISDFFLELNKLYVLLGGSELEFTVTGGLEKVEERVLV